MISHIHTYRSLVLVVEWVVQLRIVIIRGGKLVGGSSIFESLGFSKVMLESRIDRMVKQLTRRGNLSSISLCVDFFPLTCTMPFFLHIPILLFRNGQKHMTSVAIISSTFHAQTLQGGLCRENSRRTFKTFQITHLRIFIPSSRDFSEKPNTAKVFDSLNSKSVLLLDFLINELYSTKTSAKKHVLLLKPHQAIFIHTPTSKLPALATSMLQNRTGCEK